MSKKTIYLPPLLIIWDDNGKRKWGAPEVDYLNGNKRANAISGKFVVLGFLGADENRVLLFSQVDRNTKFRMINYEELSHTKLVDSLQSMPGELPSSRYVILGGGLLDFKLVDIGRYSADKTDHGPLLRFSGSSDSYGSVPKAVLEGCLLELDQALLELRTAVSRLTSTPLRIEIKAYDEYSLGPMSDRAKVTGFYSEIL